MSENAADLATLARTTAEEARGFLSTVTEVAAGTAPEASLPLLLLALSDLLSAGARLGATTDIVPVRDGAVVARGVTDHERMAVEELLYTGLTRTAVMAMERAALVAGERLPMMAECGINAPLGAPVVPLV